MLKFFNLFSEANFESLRTKCDGLQKDLSESENDYKKMTRQYERSKITKGIVGRDNERLKSECSEKDKLIEDLKVRLRSLEQFSEQRQRFFEKEVEEKNEIVAGLHQKIAQSEP